MLRGTLRQCRPICPARRGLATQHRDRAQVLLPQDSPSLLPLLFASSNLVFSQRSLTSKNAEQKFVHTRTAHNTLIHQELVIPFFLSAPTEGQQAQPTGFLRPDVMQRLQHDHSTLLRGSGDSPWLLGNSGGMQFVSFSPSVNRDGKQSRTFYINQLITEWRKQGLFQDILRGWSNEDFPIYHYAPVPNHSSEAVTDPVAFSIERAALPLFGFANFGCLLTAYYRSPDTGKTMFWIPRRSKTKRTWPGRLDVTVGGGMSTGDTASATIIRECAEEASLDANFVQENLRPAGVLPFPNRSPAGWILPGLYYLFDLPLPSDGSVRPKINTADGEVEEFELMDAQTVLDNLITGVFKPSSALALVDFLIRHGSVTEETDPRFVDICLQLRQPMPLPLPWRL